MRGGAQSHLMLGADTNLYVVKFQNNPQHIRVLANELLATRLAEAIGLSVPPCEVMEVTDWLIENTAELSMDFGRSQEKCLRGLQFGSRYVGGLMPGQVVDYLPEENLLEIRNMREFAGMLALDKWTCNVNGRQAVFVKTAARTAVRSNVCGPRVLLSRRRMEVCRCSLAWGVCAEPGVPGSSRLGEL